MRAKKPSGLDVSCLIQSGHAVSGPGGEAHCGGAAVLRVSRPAVRVRLPGSALGRAGRAGGRPAQRVARARRRRPRGARPEAGRADWQRAHHCDPNLMHSCSAVKLLPLQGLVCRRVLWQRQTCHCSGRRALSPAAFAKTGRAAQGLWWYAVLPSDALEVVRVSALKSLRALQTLARLAVQAGSAVARHRCANSRSREQARASTICPFQALDASGSQTKQSVHAVRHMVPSLDAKKGCRAARRLTLQLRVSRRWQGAKARCAALAGAPLLWCSAASHVLVRPAAASGSARREDSREGYLQGRDSGASVMAQDGSGGIVRAVSDGDVVMSTAESSPVVAGSFAPLDEEGMYLSGAALCKKNF